MNSIWRSVIRNVDGHWHVEFERKSSRFDRVDIFGIEDNEKFASFGRLVDLHDFYFEHGIFTRSMYDHFHAVCPECGCQHFETTLMSSVAFRDRLFPPFKDRNSVKCNECGWTGDRHMMITRPICVHCEVSMRFEKTDLGWYLRCPHCQSASTNLNKEMCLDDVIKIHNHFDCQLRVVGVSCKDEHGIVYCLPRPARHCDVISLMIKKHRVSAPVSSRHQGFLLNDGRVVDRVVARKVAEEADQLLERAIKSTKLSSEDVW